MSTNRLLPVILVLSLFITFLPAERFGFILFDDNLHLFENPSLQTASPSDLKQIWERPYFGMYIPVTYSLWWLETRLGRTLFHEPFSAAVYHGGNILLHSANTLLVYLILISIGLSGPPAIIGSLLFALHPLQVESVAWISCLKDVLSGGFALFGILAYLKFTQSENRPRIYWAVGFLVCILLGTLSKPSAVSLCFAAPLLSYLGLERKQRLGIWLPAIGLAVVIPIIWLTRSLQPSQSEFFRVPFAFRLFVAGDAICFYLSKLFLPLGLTLDYGRNPQSVLSGGFGYLAWLVPAGLACFAFWKRNSRLTLVFGLFVLFLLPTLGLVEFRYQQYSTVADRYLYLAMLAPALAAAYLVKEAKRQRRVWMFAAVCLCFLSFLSREQLSHWSSSKALFTYMVSKNPQSLIAHNNLGGVFERENHLNAALKEYRISLTLNPAWLDGRYNVANILGKQRKYDEAIKELRTTTAMNPDYPEGYYLMGIVYTQQGKLNEAVESFRQGLPLSPNKTKFLNKLGIALTVQGNLPSAARVFEQALAIDPSSQEAINNFGVVRMRQKRLAEAAELFKRALNLDPGNVQAKENLGVCLAHPIRRAERQRP